MSRPTYETPANRKLELRAAESVRKLWWPDNTTSLFRLAQKSVLDLAFCRGPVILGFGEIKVRTNTHDTYPTYMLSLEKWQVGVALRKNLRLPVWLFVQFSDKLMWAPFDHTDTIEVGMGGRFDRGDKDDLEPVVLIPMNLFEEVVLQPLSDDSDAS